jgi:hypothetical protein
MQTDIREAERGGWGWGTHTDKTKLIAVFQDFAKKPKHGRN